MTSFIAVYGEGETLEQSGSQALANKVVDCKYSVQFVYVFYTHYRSLIQPWTWWKWNMDDFSNGKAGLVHVDCRNYFRSTTEFYLCCNIGKLHTVHTFPPKGHAFIYFIKGRTFCTKLQIYSQKSGISNFLFKVHDHFDRINVGWGSAL